MSRKSRIDAAGAIHHVTVRGIETGVVFRDGTDRNNFLGRLIGIRVSWAARTNRKDLVAITPSIEYSLSLSNVETLVLRPRSEIKGFAIKVTHCYLQG